MRLFANLSEDRGLALTRGVGGGMKGGSNGGDLSKNSIAHLHIEFVQTLQPLGDIHEGHTTHGTLMGHALSHLPGCRFSAARPNTYLFLLNRRLPSALLMRKPS